MPPEQPAAGSAADWLRRAKSDLTLAGVKRPPLVMLEDLCFHAQQAAEKALKALLVSGGADVPRTHNIRTLLDIVAVKCSIPNRIQHASILTEYAVSGRYPGEIEPITEEDYTEALSLATSVVQWVEQQMETR